MILHPVDQAMHIGGTVQFSVTATGNGATYHWQTDTGQGFISMNNGGQYSGVATPVLSVSSLSMANQGQRFRCIVTLRSCKEISNDAAIRIALDADTLAEIPVIMLYPNPNSGVFTIRLNQAYPFEDLRVRDMLGRDMPIQYRRESDEIRIQSASLEKGNYTVSIKVAGSAVSKVFTVE